MPKLVTGIVAFALAAAIPAFTQQAGNERMNQIQVLGSHNSYHTGIDPALFALSARQVRGAHGWTGIFAPAHPAPA